MYFLDDQHELNFNHLSRLVFPHSKNDPEYRVVAYILSIPRIYNECIDDTILKEYPFLWMFEYEDRSYKETDSNGEEVEVLDFHVPEDQDERPFESKRFAVLSSGEKHLLYLAQNLFNSSNDTFNLMDALGTWDEHNIEVYKESLSIRTKGRVSYTQKTT